MFGSMRGAVIGKVVGLGGLAGVACPAVARAGAAPAVRGISRRALLARHVAAALSLTPPRGGAGIATTRVMYDESAAEAAPAEAETPVADDSVLEIGATGVARSHSEVDDPVLIFEHAWRNIEREVGALDMVFPKEIIWLAGAPGAGKGSMSGFIMEERGIHAPALETSSLFSGEDAERMKAEGRLLGDREVVEAVFRRLLSPDYAHGVIVDGMPRTVNQAKCIKFLHQRMAEQYTQHLNDPVHRSRFRRPVFHLCVLYVDEAESIRRQMHRGIKAVREAEIASALGDTDVEQQRATDADEALARRRYAVFKETVYPSLRAIRDKLHFHFIDASGSIEEVKMRVKEEFQYQSSLELGEDTFELLRSFKSAPEIVKHARQNLVQRLNTYAREHRDLLLEVLDLLNSDFEHIMQRQALAGQAIIRSNSPLLNNPVAVNMLLDILAERGYYVTLDINRSEVPRLVEPPVVGSTAPQRIRTRTVRNFIFNVTFEKPRIRRG